MPFTTFRDPTYLFLQFVQGQFAYFGCPGQFVGFDVDRWNYRNKMRRLRTLIQSQNN